MNEKSNRSRATRQNPTASRKARAIQKRLEQVLMHDSEMDVELFHFDLESNPGFLQSSMERDREDYIFAVTENRGDVAMVSIEKAGQIHANEQARERLKALWSAEYKNNMKMFLPSFAEQLSRGELAINGVKVVDTPR